MHQAEGAHLHLVWAVRRVSLTEVGKSSFSRTKDSFSLVSRRKPSSFAILVITNYSRYSLHSILQPVFVSPLRDYKFSQTQAYISFFVYFFFFFFFFYILLFFFFFIDVARSCMLRSLQPQHTTYTSNTLQSNIFEFSYSRWKKYFSPVIRGWEDISMDMRE